jgi:CRP-like cAMP-binding protein
MCKIAMQWMDGMDLFRGCRPAQLKMIDRLGAMLVVPAGRTLYCEGEPGSQFFMLIEGLAQVQNSCGRLALMHGGAWFGEAALINKTTQRASVTTVVECRMIVFDRSEFNALRHIAPLARKRLDSTAAFIARGDAPTSQWYQPILVHAPNQRAPAHPA